MSVKLPSRRVLVTTPTILKTLQPTLTTPFLHSSTSQRRTLKFPSLPSWLRLGKNKHQTEAGNLHDPATRRAVLRNATTTDPGSSRAKREAAIEGAEQLTRARLDGESIFEDEKVGGRVKQREREKEKKIRQLEKQKKNAEAADMRDMPAGKTAQGLSLLKAHIQPSTDPDPRGRQRWQRKMVMRDIRRTLDPEGRETKAEKILRTEKSLDSHSHYLGTSTKKLVHLARQVQGKTVEDALVQMQFSRKKFAKEVKYELLRARDTAMISRGMGLGEGRKGQAEEETKKIQLKDGKWLTVTDPTQMYVAEAWVEKGPRRGFRRIYNAKGRNSLMEFKQSGKLQNCVLGAGSESCVVLGIYADILSS